MEDGSTAEVVVKNGHRIITEPKLLSAPKKSIHSVGSLDPSVNVWSHNKVSFI